MDCGSLKCSFVDSSSEREVINTGQCWHIFFFFFTKKTWIVTPLTALNGDVSRQVYLLALLTAVTDKLGLCLTLHACPSSMAALWASTGLSITLPILPEKSIATREFSDTLRYRGRERNVSYKSRHLSTVAARRRSYRQDGWATLEYNKNKYKQKQIMRCLKCGKSLRTTQQPATRGQPWYIVVNVNVGNFSPSCTKAVFCYFFWCMLTLIMVNIWISKTSQSWTHHRCWKVW